MEKDIGESSQLAKQIEAKASDQGRSSQKSESARGSKSRTKAAKKARARNRKHAFKENPQIQKNLTVENSKDEKCSAEYADVVDTLVATEVTQPADDVENVIEIISELSLPDEKKSVSPEPKCQDAVKQSSSPEQFKEEEDKTEGTSSSFSKIEAKPSKGLGTIPKIKEKAAKERSDNSSTYMPIEIFEKFKDLIRDDPSSSALRTYIRDKSVPQILMKDETFMNLITAAVRLSQQGESFNRAEIVAAAARAIKGHIDCLKYKLLKAGGDESYTSIATEESTFENEKEAVSSYLKNIEQMKSQMRELGVFTPGSKALNLSVPEAKEVYDSFVADNSNLAAIMQELKNKDLRRQVLIAKEQLRYYDIIIDALKFTQEFNEKFSRGRGKKIQRIREMKEMVLEAKKLFVQLSLKLRSFPSPEEVSLLTVQDKLDLERNRFEAMKALREVLNIFHNKNEFGETLSSNLSETGSQIPDEMIIDSNVAGSDSQQCNHPSPTEAVEVHQSRNHKKKNRRKK